MFLASLLAFITAGILLLVLIDQMRGQPHEDKNLLLETAFLIGLLCMLFVAGHALYGAIHGLT
ncbi:hypothetical protein ACRQ5Q_15025 [Bradyrhizobium sp. PMVTL-01]|uniref:hypothetical protein n=1 Tax=Bradyrhizobium sp. PMVTL-01 TaxID=3434999 RepID=UPI003F71BF8A